MAETTEKPKAWTDTEKLGLILQIIEQAGPIPWDSITLPEGRTKKACTVMIDREKGKVKKAREEAGGEASTPAPKRKAEGDASAKKPRKKKAKAESNAEDEAVEKTPVKAEVED